MKVPSLSLRPRGLLGMALLLLATPALADEPEGTSGRFVMPELAQSQIEVTRGDRPPMDRVGGFQLSAFFGAQLRGSASGTAGLAIGYYKPTTASIGGELETGAIRGPTGNVYYGLMSIVLQSGARSARMVPYATLGAGAYHATEQVQDNLKIALASIGIVLPEESETGLLLGFGVGVRYYLSPTVSFRVDYREFRGLTSSDSSFWDRWYAMRRIAGFFSFGL